MADFIRADLRGSRFERVDLSGAQLRAVDLSGARFRGVDLSGVVMRGVELVGVDIHGEIESVTINGVDIVPLVNAELDARYPGRAKMRPADPAGFREAWDILERLWGETVERARRLPPELLHESVDGEWSYVETLRHLVFATDRWITGPVLNESEPFHRLGMPNDDPEPWRGTSIDIDARPTLDEVLDVRAQRMASVAALLAESNEQDLARIVSNPNGGTASVRGCIHVVLGEEWAHDRYANRDLDALGAPKSD